MDFGPEYRDFTSPPYNLRVGLAEFSRFDPLSLPWKEMRKYPERFPACDVAKVSSKRTVVGMDVDTAEGARRIYIKRSYSIRPAFPVFRSIYSPKEYREFQLALKFLRQGTVVPRPVFYAEGREPSGRKVVFIATLALDSRWQCMRGRFETHRTFEEEWDSLAVYTRLLHEREILHADYRSDHLFWNTAAGADAEAMAAWAMIDLDGSRVGKAIGRKERFRAMCQLMESLQTSGIRRLDIDRFLGLYDPEGRWRLNVEEIASTVHTKSGEAIV